jgi:hypothetical protein|tara:strand:- start:20622 stop:20894 length:273 start_codon:yes stop_codon:yes gene_type:complete
MSNVGDDDREFDDARDAFDEDAPAGDVAAAFVPHADQRDAEVYHGSDGDDVDDDDGLGSDDESDGEDLMNDMERCGEARRGEAREEKGER